MDEILYELREHAAGLNAGRWDYIFSLIKKFRTRPDMILPDRAQVTMAVPFMRAYQQLLVQTCHRRGAHAIGGMSAFIPNRRDPEVTARAIEQVVADKRREAGDGSDGSWVAHPDLVSVVTDVFDKFLGDDPNQKERVPDVAIDPAVLLDTRVPGGAVTEAGVRTNVAVALQYLAAWLDGNGAVAINNLMEDAATAEISRSQLWQWVHLGARLATGEPVSDEMVRSTIGAELERLRGTMGDRFGDYRFDEARELFEHVALSDELAEFLTIPAYELID
jgi:malate synthase